MVNDDNGTSGDTTDDIQVGVIGSLSPLAFTNLTLSLLISEDTTNIATATGFYGDNLSSSVTDTDDARVEVVTTQPVMGLRLIKTAGNMEDGQVFYTVPGSVVLTYNLINEGQEILTDINVVDDLQGNDSSGCTDNPDTDPDETVDDLAVGTVSSLAPGAQATLSARVVVRPVSELATEIPPIRTTACAVGRGAQSRGIAVAIDDAVIQLAVWSSITPSNSALTDLWITSFAISPFFGNDQTIFAGSAYGGLFKSTNAGSKNPIWQRVNQGLEPEWA
ncbi:MAG: hypothetical protein HW403_1427, partial [Dehalococcoidia bacterium]|nr:hypothetical protein [Dehalococcoidia bacterium]